MHDITHIDALWETAELLLSDDESLTPLEAFTLGCAFLIHDLGLSLAAYPNGLSDLKAKPAWQDLLIGTFRRRLGRDPEEAERNNPPLEIAESIAFEMVRDLHAETASQLLSMEWRDSTSKTTYRLLDDVELLASFGMLIGMLGHSHWWHTEELASHFPQKLLSPPVGFPREWTIDPLKLAMILRLADIAHIDARRAPTFLKLLRRPAGLAEQHWSFQEKLYQLRREGDRLVYTGQPFRITDAQAWWLCFDTLQNVDEELRKADNLNVDLNRRRFAAQGVLNSENPLRLRSLVPTEGWTPVDARIRVGSVASLVSRMGGRELYGDNQVVPLRELIQNAADAVRARRLLEKRPPDWGAVLIRTGADAAGPWLEVEDNGVGMSVEVLTGHLLDFGNSFWTSKEATTHFPGLTAKGFKSTGQYGIGFFSLFMWGDRVRVVTRRYDEAVVDTRVLEFEQGLQFRPILRPAAQEERLFEGGTRVRVWPRSLDASKADWLKVPGRLGLGWRTQRMDLASAAVWLCPALDVTLSIRTDAGANHTLVRASDWLDINGEQLLTRVLYGTLITLPSLASWGKIVRPLFKNGQIVGRGCIMSSSLDHGYITIGGFRSNTELSIAAMIQGYSARVSREEALLDLDAGEVARWASEQATLVRSATSDEQELASAARSIAALGGDIGDLPIAKVNGTWLNLYGLSAWAEDKESVIAIEPSDAQKIQERSYGYPFLDNVVIEPTGVESLIEVPIHRRFDRFFGNVDDQQPRSVRRPVVRAVAAGWSLPPEKLEVWSGDGFQVTDDGIDVDADEIRRPDVEG